MVREGKVKRTDRARLIRDGIVIHTGSLAALKRFKEDVKEIAPAQECGLGFGSFEAFQEGDVVECYEMEELPKTL
jgi:translation initiation factor IF-2